MLDLKINFAFSVICLLLEEELAEKVSASASAMSFIFVTSDLFLIRFFRGVACIFPEIFRIIFQTVLVLVEELSLLT